VIGEVEQTPRSSSGSQGLPDGAGGGQRAADLGPVPPTVTNHLESAADDVAAKGAVRPAASGGKIASWTTGRGGWTTSPPTTYV
jgi:hypothetical protein